MNIKKVLGYAGLAILGAAIGATAGVLCTKSKYDYLLEEKDCEMHLLNDKIDQLQTDLDKYLD